MLEYYLRTIKYKIKCGLGIHRYMIVMEKGYHTVKCIDCDAENFVKQRIK